MYMHDIYSKNISNSILNWCVNDKFWYLDTCVYIYIYIYKVNFNRVLYLISNLSYVKFDGKFTITYSQC